MRCTALSALGLAAAALAALGAFTRVEAAAVPPASQALQSDVRVRSDVVTVGHRYRRYEVEDDYFDDDVIVVERTYRYRRPAPVYIAPPPVTVYPAPVVTYPRPVVVYPGRYYGPKIYDRHDVPHHEVYEVVRPSSCGVYRYWRDDRCVDARWHKPYVGPRY